MKPKIEFNIESLLYGIESPKGKIDLVLFAKKVAEHEGMQFFNCLAQVKFTDRAINKALPGAIQLDETLLIGSDYWDGVQLHLCIKSGNSCCPIATGDSGHHNIDIHYEYRDIILLKKLSDKDIADIFNYAWSNLNVIRPKPGSLDDLD